MQKEQVLTVIEEYKNPKANGEYGSVALLKVEREKWEYIVAIDYNANTMRWRQFFTLADEESAREVFSEQVERVNERTEREIALQRCSKRVVEQFHNFYWLEVASLDASIVLCYNYNELAEAGKQWNWGVVNSWRLNNADTARKIFVKEIIKLTQENQIEEYVDAEEQIIEEHQYLSLIELNGKFSGYIVVEKSEDRDFLAFFKKNEERYARWVFEYKKAEVDMELANRQGLVEIEKRMEELRQSDFKIIGFTSYDNPKIEQMVCRAERAVAWEKIVEFMREHGLRFSGTYHQNGSSGAPVFSNGRMFTASTRTWGALMAEVEGLSNPNSNKDMSYTLWAWSPCKNEVHPSDKGIKVFNFNPIDLSLITLPKK